MERTPEVVIELSEIKDSQQLQLLLRDVLDFPGWYGCNWDAFWDAITGLVEMPVTLRLIGWSSFETRLPRDAQLMKDCLLEMSERYPEIASNVIYA